MASVEGGGEGRQNRGGRGGRRRKGAGTQAATPRPEVAAPTTPEAEFAGAEPAFYRFSAFLGLAGALAFAAALVLANTNGALERNSIALLVVAAILGTLYLIPRIDEVMAWVRTRTARKGSTATLVSVAFIGILVVGNWYANRHSPQWDLTAARRFTLSDQTVKILNQLDLDVKITAFLPSTQEDAFTRGAKDLLRQYQRRTSRITLEIIDPELNPGAAQQFAIQSYTTIFQAGDRKEKTTGLTEQDFTSSLLKLSRTEKKKVYFLQGHQERDPTSSQQNGYNSASEALKRENYLVESLSLLTTQTVPADAAVLVIAGPRAALLEAEVKAISDYLNRGGHVFYLAELRQDAGLTALMDSWYVQIDDNFVVDQGRNLMGDALSPAPVPQVGHRISTSLTDVIMPGTRSLAVKPGAGSDFAIAPVLRTTNRSWGETNFTVSPRLDSGEDKPGPLPVAIAVNKTDPVQGINPGAPPVPTPAAGTQTPKGRLVVSGNVEFASNALFTQVPGNRDFFVNSVNWLAEDEDLISIRAEPGGAPPVVMTNQSLVLVFWTTVIFIPLSVLLVGGTVWWQRR